MKLLILAVVIIGAALAENDCIPRGQYWRPYTPGVIPPDAFVAGIDKDGRKSYVAKIVPLDEYLWTTPAQLKDGYTYIDFGWYGSKVQKIEHFIEILCVEYSSDLHFEKVEQYPDELLSKCCLFQGGIGLTKDHMYNLYIGKYERDGYNYIGRTYMKQDFTGVHFMYGQNSTKINDHFEVLTYNCHHEH